MLLFPDIYLMYEFEGTRRADMVYYEILQGATSNVVLA
jgi:hypothetical protein